MSAHHCVVIETHVLRAGYKYERGASVMFIACHWGDRRLIQNG